MMATSANAVISTTESSNGRTVTSNTLTTAISTGTTQSIPTPISSSNLNSNSDMQNIRIEGVAIKPPPFWKTSPKLWFSHLEAQFATGGITTEDTKYYYVVAALDEQMLKLVSDIVEKPPSQDKYKTIRDNLIKSLSESETQQLQNLLQGMELGDQKPSQLLRQMRSSNGFALLNPVLKNLWLQRLPQQAQIVLAASPGNLDELAILADKILETFRPSTLFAVSSTNQESRPITELSALENKLDELMKHINLAGRSDSNNNRRNRSSSRSSNSRNRSNSPKDYKYCWYHFRFGADATQCNSPCQFKSPKK